jgi:methionyl-tRNA synthetase
MSKSLGNVVDPFALVEKFGPDALRYYLLREIPFGLDGNYTDAAFELRFNSDLANDLGNLVHRSLSMLEKYFEGVVPKNGPQGPLEAELKAIAFAYAPKAREAMVRFDFPTTLTAAWDLVKRANKYVEESAPWKVAKDNDTEKLGTIMYSLVESLRVTAISIAPFLPFTAKALWEQLGFTDDVHGHQLDETSTWGLIPSGQKTQKGLPLFPRIEKEETNTVDVEQLKKQLHTTISGFLKSKNFSVEKCGWVKATELTDKLSKNDANYFVKIKKIREPKVFVFTGDMLNLQLLQEQTLLFMESELKVFVERNVTNPPA